jgi:transposase
MVVVPVKRWLKTSGTPPDLPEHGWRYRTAPTVLPRLRRKYRDPVNGISIRSGRSPTCFAVACPTERTPRGRLAKWLGDQEPVSMDSDRRSAQVERLQVVDTGRRRRWSEEEKLKIVVESFQGSRQVAATARLYGLSRSLLLRWRRYSRSSSNSMLPASVPSNSLAALGQTLTVKTPVLSSTWRARPRTTDAPLA